MNMQRGLLKSEEGLATSLSWASPPLWRSSSLPVSACGRDGGGLGGPALCGSGGPFLSDPGWRDHRGDRGDSYGRLEVYAALSRTAFPRSLAISERESSRAGGEATYKELQDKILEAIRTIKKSPDLRKEGASALRCPLVSAARCQSVWKNSTPAGMFRAPRTLRSPFL